MSATGFLDACGFNPASGGTGDFVVSAAITGYQTPAGAGAVNGTIYSYRAQSTDLSQWEVGFGAYTSGTTTLARTTVVASSTGSKVNFSAPPSVYVTALSADILSPNMTANISVGFTSSPNNIGTFSSFTINPALGNYQYGTNNGAFTLTAPTSDCAIDLLITNGASAGSVTFSGFTVGSVVGDALTTTNGHRFIVSIRRIAGVATYMIKALQ